jgi:hypothetical protein
LLTAAETPPTGDLFDLTSPLTYVNYGVLGIVVFLFIFRKIVTIGELNDLKAKHAAELDKLEAVQSRELANLAEAKNREIARLEEDKVRLISERNQALAETDAAYQVVTDFNHMAGGLIQKLPTISPDPRTRRKPGGSA